MHDPVGVTEPADAPLGQRCHQDRVDQDVDARSGEPDGDGDEQGHDLPEFGIAEAQDGAPSKALPPQVRHLDQELHQAADEDPDGQAYQLNVSRGTMIQQRSRRAGAADGTKNDFSVLR